MYLKQLNTSGQLKYTLWIQLFQKQFYLNTFVGLNSSLHAKLNWKFYRKTNITVNNI